MSFAEIALQIFDIVKYPPGSAILIMGVALLTSTITQLITRLITDTRQLKRYTKQQRLHKEAKKKAEAEGNVKKIIQLRRKDKYIQKIATRMAKERIKPLIFTFVPLIVLFFILNGFFTDSGGAILVAYTPFRLQNIPFLGDFLGAVDALGFGLYFTFWYIIVNFSLATVLQRLFGTAGE
jgi:uncharacterized membrane protein (DUF106 family)